MKKSFLLVVIILTMAVLHVDAKGGGKCNKKGLCKRLQGHQERQYQILQQEFEDLRSEVVNLEKNLESVGNKEHYPCKNGGTCKDVGWNKYECLCEAGSEDSSVLPGSKILQGYPEYSKQLEEYLRPVKINGASWTLCYRASENHFLMYSFNDKCTHKGSTVLLVRSGQYVFGAFVELDWARAGDATKNSERAFLFSLKNHLNHPFKAEMLKSHVGVIAPIPGNPYLRIGSDFIVYDRCNDKNDLNYWLGIDFKLPFNYAGYQDVRSRLLLTGSMDSRCDEWEVFYQA